MKTMAKPDLGFWKLWNLSFGFFGVQIAYALQSANISRIFQTLGADPHNLSYFWILPPLAGLIIQPIIGTMSDRTWNRFGRRLPYLLFGSILAVIVMCLLPNAGSFHFAVAGALIFGAFSLMMLDVSINISMQPFKMLVGDMVNEKQKGLAYSIQSFLCNAGSVVGFIFPFMLAWVGISNDAPGNQVPDSVTFSFYGGAAILIACVAYTFFKVKEMPPAEYAAYHGITDEQEEEKANCIHLLVKAPKVFWTVGLVQFFCWCAFMYMWTYNAGGIAEQAFGWNPDPQLANDPINKALYQEAGNWNGILFRSPGYRIGNMGGCASSLQQPPHGLLCLANNRRNRIHIYPGILRQMAAVYQLFPRRHRMGRNARHAIHHTHQLNQRKAHGCVPRVVQQYDNHTSDCRSRIGWRNFQAIRWPPPA